MGVSSYVGAVTMQGVSTRAKSSRIRLGERYHWDGILAVHELIIGRYQMNRRGSLQFDAFQDGVMLTGGKEKYRHALLLKLNGDQKMMALMRRGRWYHSTALGKGIIVVIDHAEEAAQFLWCGRRSHSKDAFHLAW